MRVVPSRKIVSFAAGLSAVLLSGCAGLGSVGSQASTVVAPATAGVTMGGKLHGGVQPVYHSTVSLYAMNTGTAYYGDTPTLAASTTTDYGGFFSFTKLADGATGSGNTYACPSGAATGTPGTSADPEMYLIASGGDTSGTINANNAASAYNNTAAKFVVVLGDCESLNASTHVIMNEITTVGTMVALQQFFNPITEAVGAPSTNVAGLMNAIGMIPNLVNVGSGVVMQSSTPTSTVGVTSSQLTSAITVTGTPEFQKMNTMANILAACVASTSSTSTTCSALTANAIPPALTGVTNPLMALNGGTYPAAATDTLLGVDYMLINPTESQDYGATGKLNNLFSIPAPSTAPYQPGLTVQPQDWTVGVNFVPSGTCPNPATGVASTVGLLSSEYGLAIDTAGNLWLGGSGSSDALAEISPQGGALVCFFTGTTGNSAGRSVAIDSKGNVWWATTQGLFEIIRDTTNSAYTAAGTVLTHAQPTGVKISGMAFDASGNLFIAADATASTFYEYAGAASYTTAAIATTAVSLGSTAMSASGYPYRNVVVSKGGGTSTEYIVTEGSGGNYVYDYNVTNGGTTAKVTTTTGGSTVYGAAEASDGTVVIGNTCCARAGGLLRVDPTQAAASAMTNYSAVYAGGQNADRSVAIDGADNIWTGGATYANDSTGSYSSVGETDKSYNALSPQGVTLTYISGTTPVVAGQTCGAGTGYTANNECQVMGGFTKSFFQLNSVYGLGIDSSGNVWGTPDFGTGLGGSYFAIVGAAVPVKTPLVNNIH